MGLINFPGLVFSFLPDLLSNCLQVSFASCGIKYSLDFSRDVFNLLKI